MSLSAIACTAPTTAIFITVIISCVPSVFATVMIKMAIANYCITITFTVVVYNVTIIFSVILVTVTAGSTTNIITAINFCITAMTRSAGRLAVWLGSVQAFVEPNRFWFSSPEGFIHSPHSDSGDVAAIKDRSIHNLHEPWPQFLICRLL